MFRAIIDVQLGIERVYGAADIWHRAITALMAELPGAIADIERAFANGKIEDVRWCVHKLHGVSIYSGTPELQVAAKALEIACTSAPDQVGDRLKELRRAATALEAFVVEHGIPEAGNPA